MLFYVQLRKMYKFVEFVLHLATIIWPKNIDFYRYNQMLVTLEDCIRPPPPSHQGIMQFNLFSIWCTCNVINVCNKIIYKNKNKNKNNFISIIK